MKPSVEGGQISWDGSMALSLLQSIPKGHGSWQCNTLLETDMAPIWLPPALPAHSLFSLPSLESRQP